MSSKSCLHLIKIINLAQNALIPHQILLIKGFVENFKCKTTQNIALFVENTKFLSTGLSPSTGRFKFIIDLGVQNKEFILKFSYCNTNFVLNLIYHRKESSYKVQPLLILGSDELESCDKVRLSQKIIDLNLLLVQEVYAEKLKECGYERLSFVFNDKCQIFCSKLRKHEIWQLNEHDLWLHFAKELLESDWGKQDYLKYIAFISCSKYLGEEVQKSQDFSYQNIKKHIKGHAALGAGGLALFSCTYFYAWPHEFENILSCFENQQKLNLYLEPDDSNYRKTRAGVYASSLGAICHEIGHIFDLGHDLDGVMGSNFDYINRVFTLPHLTEHLPARIVKNKPPAQPEVIIKPRFTQLKSSDNSFLLRYREQQESDSFYFSPNSAVILAHHPWVGQQNSMQFENPQFELDFDKITYTINSLKYPLKIIEIREVSNSLVIKWIELQKKADDKHVLNFNLKTIQKKLLPDHYIFVMSIYGHTKKIEI